MIPEQNSMLWRVDVRGRYLGQDVVNTFQYIGGVYDVWEANATQVFQGFTNGSLSMYQILLRAMVEDYISRVIIVYRESANPARRYSQYFPVSDPGGIEEAGLPAQCAAVIIRRALPQNAVGLRGRVFIGAVPVIYTNAGSITDGTPYALALSDLQTRMRGSMRGAPTPAVTPVFFPIISTSRRSVQPPGGINWNGITDTVTRTQLGNQRRRCPGHGRRG